MSDIIFGPVGGHGGDPFKNYTIPEGAHLTQLHLYASNFVNAIQITYTTSAGEVVTMDRIGGQGGDLHTITFDPDEYITVIGGRCGWFIDNLYIGTNKQATQTYGGLGGEYEFHFPAPKGNAIIGFFGRSAWYIDKLGIIARPWEQPISAEPDPQTLQKVEGIGPKVSALLIEAGIPNLTKLATTPVHKLRQILEQAGKRYRLIDPTTWPEQAGLGAAERWEELKQLQATLKSGRRIS